MTDQHSAEARDSISELPPLWFTPLHAAEWAHAIAQQVFRSKMSGPEVEQINRQLGEDRKGGLWMEVQMTKGVFELCAELADKYGAKFGIRTLDSLHVACAVQLKAERFWTFDERQGRLAKAVGLKVA